MWSCKRMDGNGQIWCGADSTTAYNKAKAYVDAQNLKITEAQRTLVAVQNKIKDLTGKLTTYSQSDAGQKEVAITGQVEQSHAAVSIEQEKTAQTQNASKKMMYGVIIGVVVLVIAIVVFLIIKRRNKNKGKA